MKRDWMVDGRRPSGICGAALLVASRIFNFNRTIKDIMKVVRIGEGTIKKRLYEFEQTPSSSLTVDEFLYKGIELAEEMDPPSFTEGKRKAKLAELEEKGELPQIMEEMERLQEELEAAIAETLQKKHKRYRKYMAGSDAESFCSTAPSILDLEEELVLYRPLLEDDLLSSIVEDEKEKKFSKEERDPEVEDMIERELNGIINLPSVLGPRPTAASLGIKEIAEDCLNDGDPIANEEDTNGGELDLTGIDDEELDVLILNEEEVKIKTTVWMRENADFLKEMKEKEEKKAKELLENPQPKKKRKSKKRPIKTEARSAREAMEKMLQEKKISNKINYDVLMNMNIGKTVIPPAKLEATTKVEDSVGSKRICSEVEDTTPVKKVKFGESVEKITVPNIPEELEEDIYEEDEEEFEEDESCMRHYYENHYDDYNGCDSDDY